MAFASRRRPQAFADPYDGGSGLVVPAAESDELSIAS
jgi:hypothetical protein